MVNGLKMRHYIARRLLLSLLVLFGVSVITFTIARVVPANPAAMWVGSHPTAEQIARAREELGLDKPLYVQYIRYLEGLVRGDLGVSIRTHDKVADDIRAFLPASLELILVGMAISLVIGVPLGVVSATRKDMFTDHFSRVSSIAGVSLFTPWLGMMAQLITVLALSFAYSLVETFLIETVFNWPGLGRYAALSIISLDYPAIMGVTIIVALVYVLLNLLVDLIQAYLDPRIRLE